MSSPTKRSETRRKLNRVGSAKKRKNHLKNHGSTPKALLLDKPNANEKAQKQGA